MKGLAANTDRNVKCATLGPSLPAVDGIRIERPLTVAKFERHRATLAQRHRAVEAGTPTGMAGPRTLLLDPDPNRILITVDAHLDDALNVARRFALAPEGAAG